jgi:DNA-binding transcriptional MocR family regulator
MARSLHANHRHNGQVATLTSINGRSLAGLLPDLRNGRGPVYTALADSVTALVVDGRIAVETRLPSERDLALALGVSRATITAAYDELRGTGFLASRTGAGSFVTVPSTARPGITRRWNTTATPPGDVIDLSCAALPAPAGLLPRALAEVARRLPALTDGPGYDPMGLPALREAVASRFTGRGLATRPDQIIITNGALHGLDLLLRLLIAPGDRVVTELPTYPGALDALRSSGARIVPIPMAADGGWTPAQLHTGLRQTAPRLAYLIPDYHNPTGALMSEEQRREVLRVARSTGTTVIVDEAFVELGFGDPVRPMAAFDSSVITIGALSKPIWGGLRIGWVRAPSELVRRLAIQRAASDMAGSVIDQLVGAVVFDELDAVAASRRAQLPTQRDALLAAVARELPQWRVPSASGGLSVWAELEAPMATALCQAVAQLGVALVPGSRFGLDGTLERFVRLPFSEPAERLEEAVGRIARAWAGLNRSGLGARQLVVA